MCGRASGLAPMGESWAVGTALVVPPPVSWAGLVVEEMAGGVAAAGAPAPSLAARGPRSGREKEQGGKHTTSARMLQRRCRDNGRDIARHYERHQVTISAAKRDLWTRGYSCSDGEQRWLITFCRHTPSQDNAAPTHGPSQG